MTHPHLSPLRSDPGYDELARRIGELSDGGQIDYFPSPGNWGDSLINAGCDEFFTAHQIVVRRLARTEASSVSDVDASRRLALVGGGGGWNRNWSSSIQFTDELSRRYREVLVLPSSYDPAIDGAYGQANVTRVARGAGASAQVAEFACHDMAFFSDFSIAPQQSLPYPLLALRRDKERNAAALTPDRNWDLSLLGNAWSPHRGFLELVARFAVIFTDRLHIAIAGAVLGADVRLLDGNYGKNAEVYEMSLHPTFPTVQLCEWDQVDWNGVIGMNPIGVSGYERGATGG